MARIKLLRETATALGTEIENRRRGKHFEEMFPDDGPFRRELYQKHMELFAAGVTFRARCFMAANRVGKTEAGAYETVCHATGRYPHWWVGFRTTGPASIWVAGKTNTTTRDIPQAKLFGKIARLGSRRFFTGTGMMPAGLVGNINWTRNIPDLADTIAIRHESAEQWKNVAGWSEVGFKSYQQGRGSFEGTERDFIWLDEECDDRIWDECMIRTATTGGRVLLTFTPVEGMSKTVMQFLPADQRPSLD